MDLLTSAGQHFCSYSDCFADCLPSYCHLLTIQYFLAAFGAAQMKRFYEILSSKGKKKSSMILMSARASPGFSELQALLFFA